MIKKAGKSVGVPVIPSRLSILTKPIHDRGGCFYCAQCGRACQAYADFSSSSVLCIPAVKTGRVTLINGAMAREVITDPKTGLATGVSYVDVPTMTEQSVIG
jgi:choline dehydrogenase-like flavoprotein